jgi:hypothetical protein
VIERPFLQSFVGQRITLPLQPAQIHIEDIAHALALTNRFGGHTKSPYSYAQHSYLAARHAPKEHRLGTLLHAARKAYIGSGVMLIEDPAYCELEQSIQETIFERFKIKVNRAVLDEIDARLTATEARDLLKGGPIDGWHLRLGEPFEERIEPWHWSKAQAQFLAGFTRLTHGRRG